MKGLIIKDFLFERQNLKTLLLFAIVFLMMSLSSDHAFSFTFILPFIAIMTCITTFNYDEYNHWDGYMSSFPVTRSQIVKSKYIFTVLMMIVATICTLILYLGFGAFLGKTLPISEIIEQTMGGIFGIC
ncbi:MAG: ABC-2 transporter permease, partial [Firmicutes bacterium]|nr:ABC-2 transporter permease [Bacillota bacterium]